MKRFQLGQDLDTNPERSWDIFFDDAFNKELCQALSLKEHQILSFHEDDKVLKISRRYITNREVPSAIKRMTGATTLGYTTHEVFDKERAVLDWTFTPLVFEEDVKGKGQIVSEALPGGRVRRSFTGLIDADVPFIGAKLEQRLVDVITESFQKGSAIMRQWAAQDARDAEAGKPLRTLTRPSVG